MDKKRPYEVVAYPKLRRALAATYGAVQRKHMTHGLIEVDVTEARRSLREHKARTGESLSFTAFIITCLAHAIDANKSLHACRQGRKHLAVFDEVDVATAVEREVAGQKQPIIFIIRAANKKTFREIHQEIRQAQKEQVERVWQSFNDFGWVPLIVFRCLWPLFWWARGRFPQVQKRYGGTVGLTSVGMFGTGGGWPLTLPYHSLEVALGGIAEKPGVVDGQIAIREFLHVTVSFDHDITDGAPAARFVQQFKTLIESGYSLSDGRDEQAVGTPQFTKR